ncbi:MAG: Regulator of competence-specific s [Rhodoglobus sp.]|nr:Regulator of competence-specific s [Rhodoglobus sp.]
MISEEVRDLLDRVERRLPDANLQEKHMFGAVAVMLDGEMIVAANKDGSLLVRVHADEDEELMRRPGTSRLVMGGRSMSTGWIRVDSPELVDDEDLDFWVERALARRA